MVNAASEFIMVYMTTADRAEADAIAEALVGAKLAACVNVLGEVASVYRWQGKAEKAAEIALIAKTRAALFDQLRDKVKALHSYETPCIVAYPMVDGFAPYLDWLRAETS
jgi:periplasmic divalent cation tolerance protein